MKFERDSSLGELDLFEQEERKDGVEVAVILSKAGRAVASLAKIVKG